MGPSVPSDIHLPLIQIRTWQMCVLCKAVSNGITREPMSSEFFLKNSHPKDKIWTVSSDFVWPVMVVSLLRLFRHLVIKILFALQWDPSVWEKMNHLRTAWLHQQLWYWHGQTGVLWWLHQDVIHSILNMARTFPNASIQNNNCSELKDNLIKLRD